MKGNLKKRLGELRRTGELQTGRQLADKIQQSANDTLFPGESRIEETAFGPCYLRELLFPLNHRHGNSILQGFLGCRPADLTLPAGEDCSTGFNPRRAIFVDLETTGLSGGTGTWAFLIGLGRLEQDSFLLRQYFLRRPAEERSILSHFADEAEKYPIMVSFNGRLFDLPLIQTRQILSGVRQTNPDMHLDLLHCARRIWKKRLASRSLRSIEENILGLHRTGDIPGYEIPAVYFDYLRRGETERLKQVFNHNVLDILSMVTLLEKISCLGAGRDIEHPAEALALGKLCLDSGRIDDGLLLLGRAAESNIADLAAEAALELSYFHKRQGNWTDAVCIWHNLTEYDNMASPTALVELAMYYEHRIKDYDRALHYTKKNIAQLSARNAFSISGILSSDALQHRCSRLQRKIERHNTTLDQPLERS